MTSRAHLLKPGIKHMSLSLSSSHVALYPEVNIPPSQANKVSFLKLPHQYFTIRTHHVQPPRNMPLVVPEVNENDQAAWAARLMGKKLTQDVSDNVSFAVKDLPKTHRVIKPGYAVTMDYVPDRLNVYLDDSDTVVKVNHG
ncbi:hypothetical protein CIHG_08620 [Coccidioides immitis H538.4]|uniref:Proteinase inhibitor I78 n=3 Tax=Coccidioides immitis TaxID=5501 RepID=A0A0J8QKG0_COCIT|nr:hypothetical protein CIRG_09818 [Coccidioides immitis RMSCC 2394]KMU72924.1 hypothetical protein CISG_09723 [Coccidioides immitis RMSCC 3703]KMU90816.1 hypothetical protein CIHG_08620 [Coccidioides immitis H538.4]TPX20425.1 hypothetical protein DIZ76_016313 [Coccidioides immitis]